MPRRRIAIVGGGIAGLAAAFELTATEALRERFEVTLYQLGWRLGGKCASGVDAAGRNIEHGLHIWFGYYENTFALLDAVYREWQPPAGQVITRLDDAIRPQPLTFIGDGGDVRPRWFEVPFPANNARPGHGEVEIDTWPSLARLLELATQFAAGTEDEDPGWAGLELDLPLRPSLSRALGVEAVHARLAEAPLLVATPAEHLRWLAHSASRVNARHAHHVRDELEEVVDGLQDLARATRTRAIVRKATGRLLSQQIEVVAAFARGILSDVLLGQTPIADLDRCDFRVWLMRHGAGQDAVHGSPFVRALYDTMFQYPEGDHARPLYGAGTAAQVVLRMLGTCAGTLACKPAAGTGQAVIAPLYAVLRARGVRFRFFHKLVDVALAPDSDAVAALRFDRQVELAAADREYVPVWMHRGLLSWGAEPDWSAIRNGPAMQAAGVDLESHWCAQKVDTVALRQGADFDDVVLAIPLGAFKRLNGDAGPCAQLMERSPRFRAMADRQRLVPSITVQVWTQASMRQLGWKKNPAAVSGPGPLGIWAGMNELLRHEPAPAAGPAPASLHYFCDVLHSPSYRNPIAAMETPGLARQEAMRLAASWFERRAPCVWSHAGSPGQFDWNVLFSPRALAGPARLADQVVHANVEPGSCCVASAPGTTASRLKCDASGFAHLYLAGSWIDTGFNTECIEAAVMSGMQAARAITGEPREIPGENFLHPEYQELSVCDLLRDGAYWLAGLGSH